MNDDDDEGGMFNAMFGGEEDEGEEEEQIFGTEVEKVPTKIKHDGCPLPDDPKGAKVRVLYEGQLDSAKIRSYEADSDTYTIVWSSSGVMQYRTKPEDINWDVFEEVAEEKKETNKVEEDELWLAARRGSLDSVKRFIESGVDFNETGKAQQRTPFYHAVFCGHGPVVEYLISRGARDFDDTAFITANAEVREILLTSGAGGKRRASAIRKSITTAPDPVVQSELRRASVVKNAESNLSSIANEVSSAQFEMLKQLEARLLAIEAAMKSEKRRPSVVVAAVDASTKSETTTTTSPTGGKAQNKKDRQAAGKKVTFDENNNNKQSGVNVETTAIIPQTKKKKFSNPVVRFLAAVIPMRLIFRRKQ